MKKILTLTTTAILIFGFIGQAADDRFKVYVSVTSDDENIKAAVESYIKRELRALRDVDIVAKYGDATCFLKILAGEDESRAGTKLGYTIAYCYYERFSFSPPFLGNISGDTSNVKSYVRIVEKFAFYDPLLGVVGGGTNDLKELCERVVVKFDTYLLELIRKQR